MTSPHLIVFVVMKIPLDNPTSDDECKPNSVRPPWIQPARKRNPPVPHSIPSMESPTQDMLEFASDHIFFPQASPPSSLTTDLSSVMSTLSWQEYSVGTTSFSGPLFDPARGVGAGAGGNQKVFMPSEELMSIFGNSDLDVMGLFSQSVFTESTMDGLGDVPHGEISE